MKPIITGAAIVAALWALSSGGLSPVANEHARRVCEAEQRISGHATPECAHMLAEAAVAEDEAIAARHKAECAQPWPPNEPGQTKAMNKAQYQYFSDCD
jgi:hypothetical protein